MVSEVYAGLSALKTAFDIAKGLKDINDATTRNAVAIELQEKILGAQETQAKLVERIGALEAEVADFQTWNAEKKKYELRELREGVLAYSITEEMRGTEPAHWVCPNCYEERRKSVLQRVMRQPGMAIVQLCQRCGWEAYITGAWRSEHGQTRSASRHK